MEREQALLIVKQQLTEQRYEHTLGVVETAVKLANQYGADAKKRNWPPFSMTMRNSARLKK